MAKQSSVKCRRKLLNPIFHLQTKKEDDTQLSTGMIKIVRRTGQLNLSGRSLTHVPDRMFTMYELTDDDNVNIDFNKPSSEDDENWWSFKPLNYLDLSSNVIQEVPSQIGMFEDLSILNLQDNSLTYLPADVGKLSKLTKLNLSHNKINKLPKEFYNLTELQALTMSHNCLETITRDIGNLIMLQQLDLSHNSLIKLPSGIGFLVRLNEINLSNNKLIELPPDIVNLRGLHKIDLTHNDLVRLPCMRELAKLQFLYAQHNNIEELPDFDGCNNLQQIYFGNNYIREISLNFCENMPHLKILDVRDNKIEQIPNEIAMLQQLIRLDLTNNDLINLPNSLGLLPHLQNLQLDGNKLKQIRADLIKAGTSRILRHLREKLDAEDVENMPKTANVPPFEEKIFPDKYTMRNSKCLNVAMKQLTSVPDQVFDDANIAEVTTVDLCKNKLDHVPTGLAMIVDNLTELNLSMNQIKEIPAFLELATKLKYLDLGNNLLNDLPACLNALCLRELIVSNNRLTSIPECVYEMEGLEILLLNDNKITELRVDRLGQLRRIATLDLSNNNIVHVPPELGNLTQLRCLELKGNCFRQPRYAILEQGTESILSYLRDRIPK